MRLNPDNKKIRVTYRECLVWNSPGCANRNFGHSSGNPLRYTGYPTNYGSDQTKHVDSGPQGLSKSLPFINSAIFDSFGGI